MIDSFFVLTQTLHLFLVIPRLKVTCNGMALGFVTSFSQGIVFTVLKDLSYCTVLALSIGATLPNFKVEFAVVHCHHIVDAPNVALLYCTLFFFLCVID